MAERKILPLYDLNGEDFPESEELPEGARTVKLKDNYGTMIKFYPGVVYAQRDGQQLCLQIIVPRLIRADVPRKWPLIVFVQGSAWRRQDVFDHLPNLLRMSQRGYVVAIVQYRPSDIAPFPAQAEDAKTAIRFMKKYADRYEADTDKVILWGDSSGGHTALMAGFTGDSAPDTPLYQEYSASVSCIVDWYGPTQIGVMNEYPTAQDHISPDSPEGMVIGGKNVLENRALAEATVPMNYLSEKIKTPPLLIMHGGSDRLVPFNQSCRLFEKMKALGKEVEFVKLVGVDHGFGGFNSDEALDIVEEFIKKYI